MTNQTNWKEYTGTDEQIAEIKNTNNGYVLRKSNGQEIAFLSIEYRPNLENTTHYWIIPDDPLREMKIKQAQTGQPVWIRWVDSDINKLFSYDTTKPDWSIPSAQYSFTPFEGEL